MKKQTKTFLGSIVAVIAILVIVLAIYIADLTAFPGTVRETEAMRQVKTDGVKSTFHQGVIYRYPGIAPMLEVSGDYYEMGVQYGVLLRPEIINRIGAMEKIYQWDAVETGVSYPRLIAEIKLQARQIASRLPQKYLDELRGVADGSGVPYDTVLCASLWYDVLMAKHCTGVLMRGAGDTLIHGRNNDTGLFGGEEAAKMVVVRYNAPGVNQITHMDWVLYMGVETGYNNKGLGFSEETLSVKEPNPNGASLPYLIRTVLEECSGLDCIYPWLDKYPTIAAYGSVWSDLRAGRGAVVERIPAALAKNELKGNILWNFNRIYDPKLAVQQKAVYSIVGANTDREKIAALYPNKSAYTVEDAVNFLRATSGTGGLDYSWCGTKTSVCNWGTSQMVVFGTNTDGFYMALGPYFAARQEVYHFFTDFTRQPVLFMPAQPLDPLVEKAAQIENRLISPEDKLGEYIKLAEQYPNDANIQFIVAQRAFKLKQGLFATYAPKSYAMKPALPEYALYAGMASYYKKNVDQAVSILNNIDPSQLTPEQELYRLSVLEKVFVGRDTEKADYYKRQKQAIIDATSVQAYYDSSIKPLVEALK
jgi:predicted choloylglycine hydrolase